MVARRRGGEKSKLSHGKIEVYGWGGIECVFSDVLEILYGLIPVQNMVPPKGCCVC